MVCCLSSTVGVHTRIPTWDTGLVKAARRMMPVLLVALVRTEKECCVEALQALQAILVENKRGLERTTPQEI